MDATDITVAAILGLFILFTILGLRLQGDASSSVEEPEFSDKASKQ